MKMHRSDILAVLSILVGVSSLAANQAFADQINILMPAHGRLIVASLGVIGLVSGQIIRVFSNPSPPPSPPQGNP